MKNKVQFVHDTNPATPDEIIAFVHCAKCLAELPPNQSPREYARTQTGWTKKGFQVVCTRHNCNITNTVVQPAPVEWQPIATAPKDGTLVLLYGEGHTRTGYYDPAPPLGPYSKWRWGMTFNPTHWLPFPPAPK